MFECHLKNAIKQCGCTPWDYPPLPDYGDIPLCHYSQTGCFKLAMKRALPPRRCDCKPDCSRIEYSTKVP